MYEAFDHTADMGLRIVAPDLDALFADAARGLFSLIVENLEDVRPAREVNFFIEGEDKAFLLFDWLSELLYTFDSERLVFSEFEVKVAGPGLTALSRGEHLNPSRHRLGHEVKAITYHGLKVERTEDGWLAEVIVDI
jgi:SHS2 domain-containing protein